MSADLLVVRRGYSLRPYDQLAEEDFLKLAETGPMKVVVTKPRSLPHNRLYWSILRSMVKAGVNSTEADLHDATKVKCGLVRLCQLPDGEYLALPDSTAFDRLDQDGFNTFFAKAVAFWRASGLWRWVAPDLRATLDDQREAA